MRTSSGASIPSLTVEPTTSSTVTMTSSPSQIPSPRLREITSPHCLLSGSRRHTKLGWGGLHLVQLHLGKEGMPDTVAACIVQHLSSDPRARVDDERARQVDRAIGDVLGGADDADDPGVGRVGEAE